MAHRYKTIVISDLHLGLKAAKAKEVIRFLKHNTSETLILNGDIIDGWQLSKSDESKCSRIFNLILNRYASCDMRVIYLRGNHDDFLDEVLPLHAGNFSLQRDYVHESCGKRYYVVHGDGFDSVTSRMNWLARLGSVGYDLLLWFNPYYNRWRAWRGLPPRSIAKAMKQKVKQTINGISSFEKQLVEAAKVRNCHGIILGHVHQAAERMIDGIHYLNSGDWVESMTALVEDFEGNWRIICYDDWRAQGMQNEVRQVYPVNPYSDAKLKQVL